MHAHDANQIYWLVLSDEQMSKRWPFSLLNDEQMSNWVGVKHLPFVQFQFQGPRWGNSKGDSTIDQHV